MYQALKHTRGSAHGICSLNKDIKYGQTHTLKCWYLQHGGVSLHPQSVQPSVITLFTDVHERSGGGGGFKAPRAALWQPAGAACEALTPTYCSANEECWI